MKILLIVVAVLAIVASVSIPSYAQTPQQVGSAQFTDDEAKVLQVLILLATMAFLTFYLASCIVVGFAANSKGLSWSWFMILSIITTPLFGILVVIAFVPKSKAKTTQLAGKQVKCD